MSFRYFLGALIAIPLLPLMVIQGKKIRKSVPKLPEAKGTEGFCEMGGGNQKIRLITIGESTIAGVGVETHQEGFSGTLAHELGVIYEANIDWKVVAKSGYTARNVLERLLPTLENESPDLMVIGLGGNDAFTLNTPWKWRKDISELIAVIKEKYPRTTIVFTNMPPIKEFPAFTSPIKFVIGNLVEILGKELEKEVSKWEGVHYYQDRITIKGWSERLNISGEISDFFSDGVHPSKLTYQTWARDLASVIAKREMFNYNSTS